MHYECRYGGMAIPHAGPCGPRAPVSWNTNRSHGTFIQDLAVRIDALLIILVTMECDVAIIGGGIAGCSTAARLQSAGLSSIVFEGHG